MPNCDFYALGKDHKEILAYLFESRSCRLFELYSAFDSELVEFASLSELEEHYEIDNWSMGTHPSLYLHVFPNNAGGQVLLKRIELDSSKCDGAKFRYSSEGWGMIQLYLVSPQNNRLLNSHTNHSSERRAKRWAGVNSELGDPDEWDWKAVTAFSRKLNRHIRKLGVEKEGSRTILPEANCYRRKHMNSQL